MPTPRPQMAPVPSCVTYIQMYVPQGPSGSLAHLICHVDGGAHECMADAQRASRGKHSRLGCLQGLVPNPQEFHKRMLLMKVSSNVHTGLK